MAFSHAITRQPGPSLVRGLTGAGLGKPDIGRALEQHAAYCAALRLCGLDVTVLPADDRFPDGTFVEDTALLVPGCAVVTRPGAPSRRGETASIAEALRPWFPGIATVEAPGTVDAGDIMLVGRHCFIGLSARTNPAGAEQVLAALAVHGWTGSTVPLVSVLHLKTGVNCLADGVLLVCGEFVDAPAFREFPELRQIVVPPEEAYAANALWVNGTVLVPDGHPRTRALVEDAGFATLPVPMSEFQKVDGGLSCLSLRW